MNLHELKNSKGARFTKKRVGRGTSSGTGKTSGRGQKGQKARSGGGTRLGFEGGQTPLFRRIPKFGFTNPNMKKFTILNLTDLEKLNFTEINHQTLYENKVIKKRKCLIKILGVGTITKPINVCVDRASKSAIEMITKVGGHVELKIISPNDLEKYPNKKLVEQKIVTK